jgi:hypothetical protein
VASNATADGIDVAQAIGTDGFPLIAYALTQASGGLWTVHCEDVACANVTSRRLTGGTLSGVSVAIGSDGLGMVIFKNTIGQPESIHCANVACSAFDQDTPIDPAATLLGTSDRPTSVAIGTDALPLIAYAVDNGGSDGATVKVAHCGTVKCQNAVITDLAVKNATDVSLAIGADGFGIVAFGGPNLRGVHCSDVACQNSTSFTTVTCTGICRDLPPSAADVAIAIGVDNLPLISYSAGQHSLGVTHCSDAACQTLSSASIEQSTTSLGQFSWITIGGDGHGLISYLGSTNSDLKAAHCADVACTSASVTTVVSGAGNHSAAVSGVDGLPLLVGFDANASGRGVRAIHCSNVFCVPYVRNR